MTFLRWAGSKKQLLDVLSCCWYASRTAGCQGRYIEAFSGSAALFFRLKPSKAILVDINEALQECMSNVRNTPLKVSALLLRYCCTESEYYAIRGTNEATLTSIERTARFIYLNRNCFNGLYRTNRAGKFNVPYGRSKKSGVLPNEFDLKNAAEILNTAELHSGDFYDVLVDKIGPGDFIYMDPPYAKRNASLRSQYGPDVFGEEDIGRVSALAEIADQRSAHFVISYAECDEIIPLVQRWNAHSVAVKRTIAANAASRKMASEVIITNI